MQDCIVCGASYEPQDHLQITCNGRCLQRYIRSGLRAALEADDCLGFDSWRQAANALLEHADYRQRWECSGATVRALEAYRRTLGVQS